MGKVKYNDLYLMLLVVMVFINSAYTNKLLTQMCNMLLSTDTQPVLQILSHLIFHHWQIETLHMNKYNDNRNVALAFFISNKIYNRKILE